MNRLKRVLIAEGWIAHVLRHGTNLTEIVANPLPDDAALVAVAFDLANRTLTLTFHSAEFEEIGLGQVIPELCPTMENVFIGEPDP